MSGEFHKQYVDDLIDALDHIMRVANASRTRTRRLRWIAERAGCAIEGIDDWRDLDLPKYAKETQRERFLSKQIEILKSKE